MKIPYKSIYPSSSAEATAIVLSFIDIEGKEKRHGFHRFHGFKKISVEFMKSVAL
jgi:hypothetical protein